MTGLRDQAGADAIIETIACRLEQPNLLDMQGIAAKRKRDREDASLRLRARQEQRRELASWVRSFKSDKGNSPLRFLESVRDGEADQWSWGPDVAAAVLGQLVIVTVEIELSSHLANSGLNYRFTLTESGEEFLAASLSPNGGQTEGDSA